MAYFQKVETDELETKLIKSDEITIECQKLNIKCDEITITGNNGTFKVSGMVTIDFNASNEIKMKSPKKNFSK